MGGTVVPAILEPESQLLCYQMSAVHGLFFIHSLIFLFTPAYKNAKPNGCSSIGQWIMNTLFAGAMTIVNILACIHEYAAIDRL